MRVTTSSQTQMRALAAMLRPRRSVGPSQSFLCRGAAGPLEVALQKFLRCKLSLHMDVLQAAEEDDDLDAAEAESDDGKRALSLSLPHTSLYRGLKHP